MNLCPSLCFPTSQHSKTTIFLGCSPPLSGDTALPCSIEGTALLASSTYSPETICPAQCRDPSSQKKITQPKQSFVSCLKNCFVSMCSLVLENWRIGDTKMCRWSHIGPHVEGLLWAKWSFWESSRWQSYFSSHHRACWASGWKTDKWRRVLQIKMINVLQAKL